MKTRLVRIGNSRGVRLPKPLIEQVGLEEGIDLQVQAGSIVIRSITNPRAGWADAAARLAATEKGLLDDVSPTRFDRDEWQW
jgi:antitoxin MazE